MLNMKVDSECGVLVLWKWDMCGPENSMHQPEDVSSEIADSLKSESDEQDELESTSSTRSTHTITFKRIGAVHDGRSQDILQTARDRIQQGHVIPVRMKPEPDNMFDEKAIAFECNVYGEWTRIGYVVTEVLDEVHDAMKKKKLISTNFVWIKYITSWSRSGPGFFEGIDVTRIGYWSSTVMRSRSTI